MHIRNCKYDGKRESICNIAIKASQLIVKQHIYAPALNTYITLPPNTRIHNAVQRIHDTQYTSTTLNVP